MEKRCEIEVEKALMGYDIKAANFKAKFTGRSLKAIIRDRTLLRFKPR